MEDCMSDQNERDHLRAIGASAVSREAEPIDATGLAEAWERGRQAGLSQAERFKHIDNPYLTAAERVPTSSGEKDWHEHDAAGCIECPCASSPMNSAPCTCPEVEARPLVVIDPEDREQVERLLELFSTAWSGCEGSRTIAMEAALRKFAGLTPKPDEPAGTFAQVEDAAGVTWCRMPEGGWKSQRGSFMPKYAQISAVRVLSEGVVA